MSPENNQKVRQKPNPNKLNLSPVVKIGLLILALLFSVFFLWAYFTPIESASISEGHVIVNTIRKSVQHLRGGKIAEIFVKEGDSVKEGDPLIQLDTSEDKIQYESQLKEYYQLIASKARLEAVLNNQSSIHFPEILTKASSNEEVRFIIQKAEEHFFNQLKSTDDQVRILNQDIAKQRALIQTGQDKMKHEETLLDLFQKEEKEVRKLREENLVSLPRLLGLQREMEKVQGEMTSIEGGISDAEQEIARASAQKDYVLSKAMQDASDQLLDTEKKISEVEGKLGVLREILDQSLIKSPIDGTVIGLKYHTVGGVIRPGDTIMDIVPNNDKLIIEAIVNPIDIDVIAPNLRAKIDFLPYVKQRETPILEGTVTLVTPDVFTDERTNRSYYKAYVEITAEELHKAPNVRMYPGMPVQVMIVNDTRTPFEYFFAPITKSFHRAFREQ